MKYAVIKNETPWTDKSIESFVRAALRGKLDRSHCAKEPLLRITVQAVGEADVTAVCRISPSLLSFSIPALRPLEVVGNSLGVRETCPTRITDYLFERTREALFEDPRDRRDRRKTPVLVSKRRPQKRPKPATKLERAELRVQQMEKQVRHYEVLLRRAKRKLRARMAIVTLMRRREGEVIAV